MIGRATGARAWRWRRWTRVLAVVTTVVLGPAAEAGAADEPQAAPAAYAVWRPYLDPTHVGANPDGSPRPTLFEEYTALAAAHPDVVKLETIGQSVDGKPIIALKVTRDAGGEHDGARPVALFVGAQHAREWVTAEEVRRLAHFFVDEDGQDTPAGRAVTAIVDATEVWFVPVANPDGYDFTFTPGNRLWRKNLRDNDGDATITASDGVDLNRNFAFAWGRDDAGSSADPSSETYRGPSAGSEPETRALDGLLARIRPRLMVSYHSAGRLLLYPFGFRPVGPLPDDPIFLALSGTTARPAIGEVAGSGVPGEYRPEVASAQYPANGETTDHAYARYGTLAWTAEMDAADPARGGGRSPFEFQDSEPDVQAAFAKNLPFALDVARSAQDPASPSTHLGVRVPGLIPTRLTTGRAGRQRVDVDAKRALGRVRLAFRIGVRPTRTAATVDLDAGPRRGAAGAVYFHRLRGVVRGARAGDTVRVWFMAVRTGERSKAFRFTVPR